MSTRIINEELFVAGWDHWEGESVFNDIRLNQPVALVREPENEYDTNAIAVYWGSPGERVKIGFVPRTSNGALAYLMDMSKTPRITASVARREISSNPWKRLAIKIEAMS